MCPVIYQILKSLMLKHQGLKGSLIFFFYHAINPLWSIRLLVVGLHACYEPFQISVLDKVSLITHIEKWILYEWMKYIWLVFLISSSWSDGFTSNGLSQACMGVLGSLQAPPQVWISSLWAAPTAGAPSLLLCLIWATCLPLTWT